MDMVFVYEDKIAQDALGNYYTGSAFSQEVFDRYLQHFDHITLLMRKAAVDPNDTETLSRMNRIDTAKIDVVLLPDPNEGLRNFLNPKVRADFKNTVLKNIRPDRAVILQSPSGSGTIAADYCHAHGIPYLAEAVGCPWDSLWNHSFRGKVLAPGARADFRRTMRNADYAVYVTSEFLQRRYPTNGKSAAISDVELQPMDRNTLVKRIEKIESIGKLKIGTAGALHIAYKGQRFVIEALAKLKAQGNESFEYHLAGGGDSSALRELAQQLDVMDLVVFDGSIPHEKMFDWFDALDLYIQPSTVESMPRALIEAMSRGLPAFGSNVGGIPELLGETCIFEKADVQTIVDKLARITPNDMEEMARNNFNRAIDFQKEDLDKKRYSFLSEFSKNANPGRLTGRRKRNL